MRAVPRTLPRAVTALLAALLTLTLVPAPAGSAPSALVPVIVSSVDDAAEASASVTAVGGTVERVVDLIDGVVANVPSHRLSVLQGDPRVASVVPDVPIRLQGQDGDGSSSTAHGSDDPLPEPDASGVASFVASAGAEAAWVDGHDGSGVGIAVVDTGLADVDAFEGRVAASADLTVEGDFVDNYGHGTFVTGLATAVAPGAHVVSVKVAGADGTTTLGQVLYALQLVDSARDRYDIGVVALAIAAPDSEGLDPMDVAVERLWADGMVVVAAAGNDGEVASPGSNPYVLTVGATDDQGTVDRGDDVVPPWSGRSEGKPEIVAPGVSVVSVRAPGSTIDDANPQARVGDGGFRGTGTSASVGVAAGAVALLLDARDVTPDEAKGRLVAGAQPLGDDRSLDAAAAIAADDAEPANADLPALPESRPSTAPTDPDRLGARSFDWSAFDGVDHWMTPGWARQAERQGIGTAGRYWAGRYWAGRYWADAEWAGRYWASSEFLGRYWAGRYWAGRYWAGRYWAARAWV